MKRAICLAFLALAVAAPAGAAVPRTLSWQGVLTDGAGTAVPDGSYEVIFRVYDVPSGGSPLWESVRTVAVGDGIFSVMLGETVPLGPAFDVPCWLGMSIEGGAELAPRTALASVPYALNADAVRGDANVFPGSGRVGIGTVDPGAPLEVCGSPQNGIRYSGTNDFYAGITANTLTAGARPYFGYMRSNSLYAYTSLAPDDAWVLYQAGSGETFVVEGGGDVGIGVRYPRETLEVAGAVIIGDAAGSVAGTIRWTGSDFEGHDGSSWRSLTAEGAALPGGSAGQTLRHDGGGWAANDNLYNDGLRVGIGTTSPGRALHVAGSAIVEDSLLTNHVVLGGPFPFYDGQLFLYGHDTLEGRLLGTSEGGMLELFDEGSDPLCAIQPDADGTGGYFSVARSTSAPGFVVDGNTGGTYDPMVAVYGDGNSAVLDMSETGNASVVFPVNGIGDAEILDEPGVASRAFASGFNMAGGIEPLRARSISVPDAGYVLVLATAEVRVVHTGGVASEATFGVSDDAAGFPANQEASVYVGSSQASTTLYLPVTCHGLFEVSGAGTYTYYLLGDEVSGNLAAWEMQLTLVYLPGSYGLVDATNYTGAAPPVAGAASARAVDTAAERAAAEALARERIEREVASLRAEIEKLKASGGNNR
ncbi:MAG: hypothetical protein JW876_04125 [Candidatus Krumholzibacteriota bacterium]|nr:hypothetical protein [Candidatus Krumholzibacteriota bacterium]